MNPNQFIKMEDAPADDKSPDFTRQDRKGESRQTGPSLAAYMAQLHGQLVPRNAGCRKALSGQLSAEDLPPCFMTTRAEETSRLVP